MTIANQRADPGEYSVANDLFFFPLVLGGAAAVGWSTGSAVALADEAERPDRASGRTRFGHDWGRSRRRAAPRSPSCVSCSSTCREAAVTWSSTTFPRRRRHCHPPGPVLPGGRQLISSRSARAFRSQSRPSPRAPPEVLPGRTSSRIICTAGRSRAKAPEAHGASRVSQSPPVRLPNYRTTMPMSGRAMPALSNTPKQVAFDGGELVFVLPLYRLACCAKLTEVPCAP